MGFLGIGVGNFDSSTTIISKAYGNKRTAICGELYLPAFTDHDSELAVTVVADSAARTSLPSL